MSPRSEDLVLTPSSTSGEWHIFGWACLKCKWLHISGGLPQRFFFFLNKYSNQVLTQTFCCFKWMNKITTIKYFYWSGQGIFRFVSLNFCTFYPYFYAFSTTTKFQSQNVCWFVQFPMCSLTWPGWCQSEEVARSGRRWPGVRSLCPLGVQICNNNKIQQPNKTPSASIFKIYIYLFYVYGVCESARSKCPKLLFSNLFV